MSSLHAWAALEDMGLYCNAAKGNLYCSVQYVKRCGTLSWACDRFSGPRTTIPCQVAAFDGTTAEGDIVANGPEGGIDNVDAVWVVSTSLEGLAPAWHEIEILTATPPDWISCSNRLVG